MEGQPCHSMSGQSHDVVAEVQLERASSSARSRATSSEGLQANKGNLRLDKGAPIRMGSPLKHVPKPPALIAAPAASKNSSRPPTGGSSSCVPATQVHETVQADLPAANGFNSPIEGEVHHESPSSLKPSPPGEELPAANTEQKGGKRKGVVWFNACKTNYDVVATCAEARGWRVVKTESRVDQCNIHWIDMGVVAEWLPRIEPWMHVNHFPGMNNSLARKSRLARNLLRMQKIFPAEYRFVPPTWVLPDDFGDLEKRFGEGGMSKTIYIVKPDHLCQGKGIFLTSELERIRQVSISSREKDQAVVVQRYISRPMLIDGLKFDLRLYFLVSGVHVDGNLEPRCHLFRDGLVRLCTTPYEPPTAETLDQKCMHLTNYAVNKNSGDFQQPEGGDDGSGSKRSLRWFLQHVEDEYGEKERQKLWNKLMGLCVKMVLTVHPVLEAECNSVFPKDLTGGRMGCRCFEILGVDVMLDNKRKPYLIEVNHLPSFTCDSPLDEDIKSRLIAQVLDLTCPSVTAKDKKVYEALIRERRELNAQTASGATNTEGTAEQQPASQTEQSAADTPKDLLELPSYKDFERAYPAPESTPKMATQCEAILERVRAQFRPVNSTSRINRTARSRDPEPQPPKPAAKPPSMPAAKDSEKNNCGSSGASYATSASQPTGRQPGRLNSGSGLPRLVSRSASPSKANRIASTRLSLAMRPSNVQPDDGREIPRKSMIRQRSLPPPQISLPMKQAQILL